MSVPGPSHIGEGTIIIKRRVPGTILIPTQHIRDKNNNVFVYIYAGNKVRESSTIYEVIVPGLLLGIR